jgi:ATP-dependent Clp protease adaptor protein ClpS
MFTQNEEDILIDEDVALTHKLIVHNDHVNTFDWVIQALMDICQHTYEQAEQCSLIIHFKGKHAVKYGSFSTLQKMRNSIVERGIGATVESL